MTIPFASLRAGLGVFLHRNTGEDARATKTGKTAPEERQNLAHGASHG